MLQKEFAKLKKKSFLNSILIEITYKTFSVKQVSKNQENDIGFQLCNKRLTELYIYINPGD